MNIPRSHVFIVLSPHRRVLLSPYSCRFYKRLCCLTPITHKLCVFQNVTSLQVRRKSAVESHLNFEGPYCISIKRLSVQPGETEKKAVRWLRSLEYEEQTQHGLPIELCKQTVIYSSMGRPLYHADSVNSLLKKFPTLCVRVCVCACACVCVCVRVCAVRAFCPCGRTNNQTLCVTYVWK